MASYDFTTEAANLLRRAALNGTATEPIVYRYAAEWCTEHGQPELASKFQRIADLLNEADSQTLELAPAIRTIYHLRQNGNATGDYREALASVFKKAGS